MKFLLTDQGTVYSTMTSIQVPVSQNSLLFYTYNIYMYSVQYITICCHFQILLFASLISAVDPVAVLAIFSEVKEIVRIFFISDIFVWFLWKGLCSFLAF